MQKNYFDGIMVTLASTEEVLKWSHGNVDSPDTINYRTGKPKQKWLFCEAIFWPVKNYECSCGKYKGVRYKWIVCERCGVEVTSSRVRRERMWHIDLASPVLHVWYKGNTSWGVHHLLNLSSNEIDKIINFVKYVVINDVDEKQKKDLTKQLEQFFHKKITELDEIYAEELKLVDQKNDFNLTKNDLEKLYAENKSSLHKEFVRIKAILADMKKGTTVLESDYRNIFSFFEDIVQFQSGPEAIEKLVSGIDIEKEIKKNLEKFKSIKSEDGRKKAFNLIKLLINLYVSGVKPENMVIKKLPVIPPDLRPVVQLDGGRFASSDVNLFYRRVLMRNIRLKKMIQVWMPDVVKKNEIRLLQESVNNLLVGEKNTGWRAGAGVKLFKSLSDMLSGKEGIFRRNLLGKRVDYSWRSVITVGPDLKLDECGLPLYIAVRMFTPFIIGKLIEKKIVYTPKQAEKLIKDEAPITLKLLEEVIKDKYVLLNRAPTLHRLSIEAFKIKLMPWKTIRIHPLVCPSFNADFDGDQMAVHLPISDEAQWEARNLIASNKNILKPASWEPVITHTQDMVLGVYYLTDEIIQENYRWIFATMQDVITKYESGELGVKDTIVLKREGEHIKTTVGRVIFNSALPEKLRFINKKITKKELKKILDQIYDDYDMNVTVGVADMLKDYGFKYATLSGTSINIFDMKVPVVKEELLKKSDNKVSNIYNAYFRWFLSEAEKHRLIVKLWTATKADLEVDVKSSYSQWNDIFSMIDSWARGTLAQATQISGMKGLVVSPSGKIIELPIKSSLIEGLNPIEYFISAHSARKGKADTALRTAESWYLTRKLCDASQEVIVRENDCGTKYYLTITKDEAMLRGEEFDDMIFGRILAKDIKDKFGNVALKAWSMIDKHNLKVIEDCDVDVISVRSPLTCLTVSGVCQKCYGMDLSTRNIVDLWSPVGVIASQSIGEPATQLTMNTFHGEKASTDQDMTQGIDRIKQLFEVRKPKTPAIVAPFDWTISFFEEGKMKMMKITSIPQPKNYFVKEWYKPTVKKGDVLTKWSTYAIQWSSKLKVKEDGQVLEVSKDLVVLGIIQVVEKSIGHLSPYKNQGDTVYKGEVITSWLLNIKDYKEIVGDLEAQKYIVREIKKVYLSQGQDVHDKHMEVVTKQLFSKVFIEDAGDSSFIPGTHVKYEHFIKVNEDLIKQGKHVAKGRRLALGLTAIAKETDSWLSAVSFQETIRVMVDSSLKGAIDELSDLKSNVIIGRLLPVGEIYRKKLEASKEQTQE